MAKKKQDNFNASDFYPTTFQCPKCGSTATHAPGPFNYDPLFKTFTGWLLCYSCGDRTNIYYNKRVQGDLPLNEGHG